MNKVTKNDYKYNVRLLKPMNIVTKNDQCQITEIYVLKCVRACVLVCVCVCKTSLILFLV